MGKQFSKKVSSFDKETYETNQQAVKTLKAAGMSQIQIAKTLKMSQSTVWSMVHKTYEEYDQYRKDKYNKQQQAVVHKEIVELVNEKFPKISVEDRLANIELLIANISDNQAAILEKLNKKMLF